MCILHFFLRFRTLHIDVLQCSHYSMKQKESQWIPQCCPYKKPAPVSTETGFGNIVVC
ncbi:hypothetical protein RUMCAL_02686 [Ruminococcus callidus ATCC 27760]|uniref:Uncharacterized protein n=1 Tax=Ruminococcus callidus ATCC 27760 TaxID=411473 RepID=U2KGC0_9FIRM|nr:hypothetical protein RUMCAL_02686 [Ruminococcus callidus ATCC 27760]